MSLSIFKSMLSYNYIPDHLIALNFNDKIAQHLLPLIKICQYLAIALHYPQVKLCHFLNCKFLPIVLNPLSSFTTKC